VAFFDKKEEVLDIQLTQYGKSLLSMGKFKPAYYAFFDDDILYDSEYGGFDENRANATERIRNDTPNCKVQYVYSGIDTNFEKAKELIRRDREPLAQQLQQTAERHYALSAPLGNSSLSDENAPAWNVNFLKGEITGAVSYKTGSHATLRVPQIEVETVTFFTSPEKPALGEDVMLAELDNYDELPSDSEVTDAERQDIASDLNFASSRFPDGSFVKIEEDYILLSVDEQNTEPLSRNFDVEVYLEETDPKTGQEVLTQLFFDKKRELIDENNILLDQDGLQPSENTLPDPSFVDNFFHVYVDEEINKAVLCKLLPKNERESMFPSDFLDCDDLDEVDDVLVVDAGNLYDSDVTPEDIDDKC
jgi:hypothetical protein